MRGGNEKKWRGGNKTEELEVAKKQVKTSNKIFKKWEVTKILEKVRSFNWIKKS